MHAARRSHARVAYVPGTGFYADGTGQRDMRLYYCFPTPDRIREGVRRLAGVIEQELELRGDLRLPGRRRRRARLRAPPASTRPVRTLA